jgi:hypothetical protein
MRIYKKEKRRACNCKIRGRANKVDALIRSLKIGITNILARDWKKLGEKIV